MYIAIVRKPPCELNMFVLQQQQNLRRRFGTSKMHLSPPVADQIHNNFTEMFPMMPSTIIEQTIVLHGTKWPPMLKIETS